MIVTRAGPAKILGLKHKGHLGIGADADITIYTPGKDIKAMFELPRMVIKAGEVVAEGGELRSTPFGPTIHVQPGYDNLLENNLRPWFEKNYSLSFANYPVSDFYLSRGERVVS